MLNQKRIELLRPQSFIIQVICASLILGVLVFAGLIAVLTDWNEVHSELTVFAGLSAGLALFVYPMAIFLPGLISGQATAAVRKDLKAAGEKQDLSSEFGLKKLASNFQTATIIRYAMLEGPLFANLLFFFLDKSLICIIVGAIGLALMVVFFPFPNRQVSWIEARLDEA